ncbi:MAG: hypothetical protein R3F43_14010 [bacterium]
MRPIGPIALSEAGIIADVRPVVLPIDDGFRGLRGPRRQRPAARCLVHQRPQQHRARSWGLICRGRGRASGAPSATGSGAVVQAGLSTFIQDFAPTLGPGSSRAASSGPASRPPTSTSWRRPSVGADVAGHGHPAADVRALDEALGDFVAGPADLLPGLRDGVNHLHVHFTPDSALGRIGVSTGIRGRVGPLGCR